MARHPATKGNDLAPNRVDAREDITVPDGNGGRVSLAEIELQLQETADQAVESSVIYSEGYAPGYLG